MPLMIEEGIIRGGICQAIHRYAKANNKYMNNYDKSIESSYLMQTISDANNLCGWAMSQKLPINGFKWLEDLLEFNESFIKNYDIAIEDIFLKLMSSIRKIYLVLIKIYHF